MQAWNLTGKTSVQVLYKPGQNFNLVQGTNPVIRLCMNSGNKIEYVPKNGGIYRDYFYDAEN
jgi:hypothetical protein